MKAAKILAAWLGEPQCEKCGIRHLALFADLAEEHFRGLHLHIEDLEFPAGTVLYRTAEPGLAVFTVRGGLVRALSDVVIII